MGFKRNLSLILIALPGIIALFIWAYLPMYGSIIAFKDYQYVKGIFGSEFVGFDNFKFFFQSPDAWRITRNTVGYSLLFLALRLMLGMFVAMMLYEVRSKIAIKFYQTSMIIPNYLSWVIIGYVSYVLLKPSGGVLNQLLTTFGLSDVNWYSEPKVWPFVLTFWHLWKSIGMESIMYYAALMGIDESLFEAADVDGATTWQKRRYITIPMLMSFTCIMLILGMGSVFRGDFGLFYQIPRDIGTLYPVTDVMDTYLYRGLKAGSMSMSSAVGLFQSVVGCILVIVTNAIVKRIDEDKAMF